MSGFSSAEAGWLSAGSGASAYSSVEWRSQSGSWRADIPIAAGGFEDGEVDIVYQVAQLAPWKASAVLRIRQGSQGRICVNRAHRDDGALLPVETHSHERRSSDHAEVYRGPELDLGITVGATVHAGAHRAVLGRLATRYNINLDGLDWTDPPEEVA